MCSVCGCGQAHLENTPHDHAALHEAGIAHSHDDGRSPKHVHADILGLDYGAGEAGLSVHGLGQDRIISIERAILGSNDKLAAQNRSFFERSGILALNLLSSPGAGKTALLCATIQALSNNFTMAVVEGDQQTSLDAERIRAAGAPAVQVNTGKGCHLDAAMVARATEKLQPGKGTVLFIENVGNLVCPAAFDLGEAARVVILSITEGEDKPLKYPDMFAAADLLILNKIDLAPYLECDIALCRNNARRLNPSLGILEVSAKTGAGLPAWFDWIAARSAATPTA
jgi:hydrogenase nickel incorporation protein HypB